MGGTVEPSSVGDECVTVEAYSRNSIVGNRSVCSSRHNIAWYAIIALQVRLGRSVRSWTRGLRGSWATGIQSDI